MKDIQLREYQIKAIDELRASFKTGHRTPVLQLPCGAGKTYLAMYMIKAAIGKGKRVAFVVDNLELLEQASKAADDFCIDHGVIQANHWRSNRSHPLQICTIQTLKRKFKDFNFVIVDEAHCMYKAQTEWMEKHSKVPFIGLSATPWTKGMGLHWDKLIKPLSTGDLIEKGSLTPFRAFAPDTPDLDGVKTVAGDYNQKELGKAVNKHKLVANIVQTWLKHGENRQTVVFCVDIAHSEAVAEEFRSVGIASEAIHSQRDTDDRHQILSDFANGEIKIVTSRDVLVKGYDNPSISCLVLARPTKSRMIHVQQIGRGIRTAEEKQDCIILDHAGNHLRMGFITDDSPDSLDFGEKKTAAQKKEEQEEPKPKECIKCHAVKPVGVSECPECGFKPTRQSEIVVEKGTLKELKKQPTPIEKAQFFSELLWYARSKNYSEGWAAHTFKKKFDHFPSKKKGVSAVKPSKETMGYIKHLQIKFNKSKKSSNKNVDITNPSTGAYHSEPRFGYNYSLHTAKNGDPFIRVSKNHKFICWAKQTPAMRSHVGIE